MGRPSFEPSQEQRETVAALAQARVSLEEIARRLGITKNTLKKYFAVELGRAAPVDDEGSKTPDQSKTPLPPFRSTPEQRELAEILAAADYPMEKIADRVGVTIAILEEHFAAELTTGANKRNADVILAIHRGAVAGNASQQRLWSQIAPIATKTVKTQRPALVGKKEAAQREAEHAAAGTDWGDLLDAPPDGTLVN
jgi:hypothetical protein